MYSTKSRSHRLKKYENVYKSYTKKINTVSDHSKPIKKKKLNKYQAFVKQQSKSDKYEGISSKDRLKKIAEDWEKHKKR